MKSMPYLFLIGLFFLYFPHAYYAENTEGKIRALLVTVDNRALVEDLASTNYVSLSAVINMQYAKRHSYDFMSILGRMNYLHHSENSSFSTDGDYYDGNMFNYILSKYNVSNVDLPHSRDSKHQVSSFNVDLKQFRAAAWSKLLVIWNLLQQPKIYERYDYIFYLDSDAVLSPLTSQRSLDDFFKDADAPGGVEYGPLPSKASILFFSNYPHPSYPCSGAMLFSVRQPLTSVLVKEWWNQDWQAFNFQHDYEQSVLRKMFYEGHLIIAHMSYLKERQFTVDARNQWLLHYGGTHGDLIRNHMLLSNDSFATAVKEIKANHSMQVNLLQIAEDISRADYKKRFAKNFEKKNIPILVTTVSRGDIFLIQYHMKRLVSEAAFEHWKFKKENVQVISNEAMAQYTLGPRVTIDIGLHASI